MEYFVVYEGQLSIYLLFNIIILQVLYLSYLEAEKSELLFFIPGLENESDPSSNFMLLCKFHKASLSLILDTYCFNFKLSKIYPYNEWLF